ncbi:hypothetical protein [Haemophilus haemolyticus]|uniref:hypothetical protein n=1 Tax=Haemophilus haemolyticus TaxID=726 RepID=UPI000E578207|nr:hypothetical protein [Haemophilus haemolyticus]
MSDYGLMTMRNDNVFFHTDNSNTVSLGFIDIKGSGSFDIITNNIQIPNDKSFWYLPTILQLNSALSDIEILAIVKDNKIIGFQWGHFSRVIYVNHLESEDNEGVRVYYGYY